MFLIFKIQISTLFSEVLRDAVWLGVDLPASAYLSAGDTALNFPLVVNVSVFFQAQLLSFWHAVFLSVLFSFMFSCGGH